MRVPAVSGLQVFMCLMTFCRQHLPDSLKDTLAVSIYAQMLQGFNCFCVRTAGRALLFA